MKAKTKEEEETEGRRKKGREGRSCGDYVDGSLTDCGAGGAWLILRFFAPILLLFLGTASRLDSVFFFFSLFLYQDLCGFGLVYLFWPCESFFILFRSFFFWYFFKDLLTSFRFFLNMFRFFLPPFLKDIFLASMLFSFSFKGISLISWNSRPQDRLSLEYIPLLFLLLPRIEVFFLVSFRYLIFSICILTLFLYYFYSSLICIFFIFTNVFFYHFHCYYFFIHFLCFRIPFLSLFLFFSFYSLFSQYSLSSPFLIAFLIHSPLRFLSLFLNPYSFKKFLFILLIVSYPILFLILSLFPFRYCISYSFSSSFLIPFFYSFSSSFLPQTISPRQALIPAGVGHLPGCNVEVI